MEVRTEQRCVQHNPSGRGVAGEVGVEHGYILAGCSPEIPICEGVLKEKWSGRLLIQAYEKRPLKLFEYLWHDIQKSLRDSLSCGGSRRG